MPNELEARLAILEAQVGELREQLARAKPERLRTMRRAHSCPSCGGGKLFDFRRVKDVAQNRALDLSLQKTCPRFGA